MVYQLLLLSLAFCFSATGQISDSLQPNKDAIFDRPFVLESQSQGLKAAIGGYIEANTNYFVTDGVRDGFGMELRRFNIFLYSSIRDRIRFISELEFEHGTEEIALETALLDFEISPSLILRAGILLVPLGYFNQNHDSPKWEFIDRPIVSTGIIPSTYSDVGFGLHGSVPVATNLLTYEIYLVNGLQDDLTLNEDNRTSLAAGKSEERFGNDNNGSPAVTGRLAFKKRKLGEFGLSGYHGKYNTFKIEGELVDRKRSSSVLSFDYNVEIGKWHFLGEMAWAHVQTAPEIEAQFGRDQVGFHIDLIREVWKGKLFRWENVILNASARFEFVDFNLDRLTEPAITLGDHIVAITPGIGLRFSPNTLIRANYRYEWHTDFLRNPTSRRTGIQFGFASYF